MRIVSKLEDQLKVFSIDLCKLNILERLTSFVVTKYRLNCLVWSGLKSGTHHQVSKIGFNSWALYTFVVRLTFYPSSGKLKKLKSLEPWNDYHIIFWYNITFTLHLNHESHFMLKIGESLLACMRNLSPPLGVNIQYAYITEMAISSVHLKIHGLFLTN